MSTVSTRLRNLAWLMALVLAISALAPGTASATLLDPSTLHIGPNPFNTADPVQLGTTNTVTVTNVSNGAGDLNVPWYLILGIPNTTTTNLTVTSVNGTSTNISPLAQPSATLTSGQEAYTQLGLDAGTNNSNSFTNWAGTDASLLSLNVTSFGLFMFPINQTLSGGGTDTIVFSSNLPQGTYVIAYGTTSTHIYDTPFTEAGLETGLGHSVPEPSTMALALSGLVGFGLMRLRRFRRAVA